LTVDALAEALAAHAELVALMRARRGRGLDLEALLAVRHLSRVYSFRCAEAACAERAIELETRAAELHAETRRGAAEQVAFLERRIDKLLGEIHAAIARRARCDAAAFDPRQTRAA
jgi:hypothetical protein